MAEGDVEYKVSEFSESFQRLYRVFTQINTHLTFLSSHSRSTIPTFDLLKKLNSDITELDLAIIHGLFPVNDVYFSYVDENQLLLSLTEKVQYTKQRGYKQSQASSMDDAFEQVANGHELTESKQVLVFDFQDTRMHGIGAAVKGGKRRKTENQDPNSEFFFRSNKLGLEPLSQIQLTRMIKSRNEKFKGMLGQYIGSFSEEDVSNDVPMRVLKSKFEPLIPKPPELNDPVDLLKRSEKGIEASGNSTLESMISILKEEPFYQGQMEHVSTLTPKQEAIRKQLSFLDSESYSIHPELEIALQHYKGISITDDLYSHQADALEVLLQKDIVGKHVIVSTATASGKSMIYQIPVLNNILWDITNGQKKRSTTAFFIFPTKALAQDQKRHLEEFISYLPSNSKRRIIVDTYDGDTPTKSRAAIRSFADIVFTNPDTIHASILPNHLGYSDESGWMEFLRGLKFIVMDELHVYKGTFGIQVSYVMSRLLRICSKMKNVDSSINFISCSATIQNPESHFRAVCAIPKHDEVIHISNDGSPSSERKLIVWNPPALMNKKGITQKRIKSSTMVESSINSILTPRVSPITESARILMQLLSKLHNIKVIVFCPIRAICELLIKEVRNILKSPEYTANQFLNESDIMSYRGGYSKEDRRTIEQKMFTGQLRAIVATNALELGIDLSDLDVVITCGFPISKSHLHQQFGRAGRGRNSRGSLAIYVAGPSPLDQYYLNHVEELKDKNSYEDLCVAGLLDMGSYQLLLEQHLQCAAFEHPIDLQEDMKWFAPNGSFQLENAFVKLCKSKLYQDTTGLYRTSPKYLPWPPDHVTIRAIEDASFAVVDITNGRNVVIEEVEASRTSFTLYEGGIFLHQGFPYLVREFNPEGKFAKVERVNVDWTTSQRDFTDIDPMEVEYIKQLYPPNLVAPSDIPVFFGKIKSTIVVFGFFKLNRRGEILEAVEVKNPPVMLLSKGFWVDIPTDVLEVIKNKQLSIAAGIHAAQHAIMNFLPLFINGAAAEPTTTRFNSSLGDAELVTECKAPEKEFSKRETRRKRPARLIFYDSKGGEKGSGMSAKAFEYFDELLVTTYEKVRDCECLWGCPQCVTGNFCKERSAVMSKPAAILILASLLQLDLNEIKDQLPDGPELNLPDAMIETIENSKTAVKFSKDVEIVKVRKARRKLRPIIKRESDAIDKNEETVTEIKKEDDEIL
ncbi:uncharacterized protein RJT20DRAFT_51992 [Scheffersomyces xylosifermentans]|uniref:uncharacterized protein n=1 Tax=Scheffersomyces xylosifermentans TaxID=1304137 RepID=UPI00315CD80B